MLEIKTPDNPENLNKKQWLRRRARWSHRVLGQQSTPIIVYASPLERLNKPLTAPPLVDEFATPFSESFFCVVLFATASFSSPSGPVLDSWLDSGTTETSSSSCVDVCCVDCCSWVCCGEDDSSTAGLAGEKVRGMGFAWRSANGTDI